MTENPYLIALALIEQNKNNAMPLGGKSLKQAINRDDDPGETGHHLAKELLLRVFQRSENGALKRAAGEKSLLLIQISIENMYNKLPLIKAKWIETGDSEMFFSQLKTLCDGIWSFSFSREDGMRFVELS